VLYLVGVDVQLRQVRIKQQLRGVYADRWLTLAFTAEYPLRVHQTPEVRTYTKHTERQVIRITSNRSSGVTTYKMTETI